MFRCKIQVIKCDDRIFDNKWVHYSDRLIYENIFIKDDFDYSWMWGDWIEDEIFYHPVIPKTENYFVYLNIFMLNFIEIRMRLVMLMQ